MTTTSAFTACIVILFIVQTDCGSLRSSPVEILIDTDGSGRNDTQIRFLETYSPLAVSGALNGTGKITNYIAKQQPQRSEQRESRNTFQTTTSETTVQTAVNFMENTAAMPGWQSWSDWTRCNNGERVRTRSCIPFEAIATTDPTFEASNNYPSCPKNMEETEKQFCFTTANTDELQKLSKNGAINSNPYTVEREITAPDLNRPKVTNHNPVKVIEIHRD